MATIANKGDLLCGGAVTVDSVPDLRWVRVTVYNRDTVDHEFTFRLGPTPVKKPLLNPGRDFTFPLLSVQSGINVMVDVGGAMVTAQPTFAVSGTH